MKNSVILFLIASFLCYASSSLATDSTATITNSATGGSPMGSSAPSNKNFYCTLNSFVSNGSGGATGGNNYYESIWCGTYTYNGVATHGTFYGIEEWMNESGQWNEIVTPNQGGGTYCTYYYITCAWQ